MMHEGGNIRRGELINLLTEKFAGCEHRLDATALKFNLALHFYFGINA